MSHAIYKYPLPVQEEYSITLPKGAKLIRAEDVEGLFFLWALVNTDPECETELRHLEFYKTGQPIHNPETLHYIGLCKLFIMQELGLYCFERINSPEPYTT